MPLFGRRRSSQGQGSAIEDQNLGRKMRSALAPDECLANFTAVVADHLGVRTATFEPQWTGQSADMPAVLAGIESQGGRAYYVAIWRRSNYSEIHFITPDYSANPTPPLIGAWKMRDQSLSSMGSVTAFPIG